MEKRRKKYRRKSAYQDKKYIITGVLGGILVVLLIILLLLKVFDKEDKQNETPMTGGNSNVSGENSDIAGENAEKGVSNHFIYLTKGNSVTWTFREDFAADYYDLEELKTSIDAEIADFVQNHEGSTMELVTYELKSDVITVSFAFDSIDSFITYYNEYTLPDEKAYFFFDTVAKAQEAEYVFEEVYSNESNDTAYLPDELVTDENVRMVITNLEIDFATDYNMLCYGATVTAAEDWVHTTAGEQNAMFVSIAEQATDATEE